MASVNEVISLTSNNNTSTYGLFNIKVPSTHIIDQIKLGIKCLTPARKDLAFDLIAFDDSYDVSINSNILSLDSTHT